MNTVDKATMDIKELIKSNLPAVASEEFARFVDEAVATKEKLAKLEERNIELQKSIASSHEKIYEFERMEIIIEDLQDREKKVKEREDKLAIDILRLKLEESEKRVAVVEDLVSRVFSNQTLITNITRTRTGQDAHGNYINDFDTEESKTSAA